MQTNIVKKGWFIAICLATICMLAGAAFLERRLQRPHATFVGLHDETLAVAANIYEGNGFGNPYVSASTGPSSHLAPAYPVLLAIVFDIAGGPLKGACWAQFLPYGFRLLGIGVFFLIVRELFANDVTATIMALFYAYLPQVIATDWEAEFTAFLLLVLFLLTLMYARRTQFSTAFAIAFAGLFTVLILTNPGAGLAAFVCLSFAATYRYGQCAIVPLAVLLICLSVGVSPWIVHLYKISGRIMPIRGNLGLELAISNNDCAQSKLIGNWYVGTFAAIHPNNSDMSIKCVRAIGDAAFFQDQKESAVRWISEKPLSFLRLTSLRLRNILFGLSDDRRIRFVTALCFALAIVQLFTGRNRMLSLLLVGGIMIYLVPYAVVQSDPRYFQPALPVLILAGLISAVRFRVPSGFNRHANLHLAMTQISLRQYAIVVLSTVLFTVVSVLIYDSYQLRARSDATRLGQVQIDRELSLFLPMKDSLHRLDHCVAEGAIGEAAVFTHCLWPFLRVRGMYSRIQAHLANTDHATEAGPHLSVEYLTLLQQTHQRLRAMSSDAESLLGDALLENPCAPSERQDQIRRLVRTLAPDRVD
jgi:hypothetical protein